MSSSVHSTGENLKGKTAMDKQTGKLIARIAENLPDIDGDTMQEWINNPRALQKALRFLCPPDETCVLKKDVPLDTIIRVDRSVRPVYPDWAEVVLHPELETVGPAEYDLAKQIELYLFGKQKGGGLETGHAIFNHLKETDSLKNCLGLHDALAIQSKGIAVFRKLFGGKAVFCWKSVARRRGGDLRVPYVFGSGGRVLVGWSWLDIDWNSNSPAARFAS